MKVKRKETRPGWISFEFLEMDKSKDISKKELIRSLKEKTGEEEIIMSGFNRCGKPENAYVAGEISHRDLPPDYPYNLTRNARRLDGLLDDLKKERNNIDLIIKKYEKSK